MKVTLDVSIFMFIPWFDGRWVSSKLGGDSTLLLHHLPLSHLLDWVSDLGVSFLKTLRLQKWICKTYLRTRLASRLLVNCRDRNGGPYMMRYSGRMD